MINHTQKKGFTLVEVMIVMSIVAVVGLISGLNLVGKKSTSDLMSTTQKMGALLREAQSDAATQSQGAQWGVHFDNTNPASPYFALFYTTTTYASGTLFGGQYPLPGNLCYMSSTISQGSTMDVIFNQISGVPSSGTSSTISLQVGGCGTASTTGSTGSLSRSGSGKIFFDDFGRTNL